MNVLFYTYFDVSPQKGGTERITSTISTELERCGLNCFLAYDCDIDEGYKKTDFNGKIKIGNLKKQKNCDKLKKFIIKNDIDIVLVQGLFDKVVDIRRIISEHPQTVIIFAHHFNPGAEETFLSVHSIMTQLKGKHSNIFKNILKLVLMPLLKIRYVYKLHKQYNQTYKNADKIVLLSKGFIGDFIAYAHLHDKKKIRVIHNALSFAAYFDMSIYHRKLKEVIIVSRLEERQKRISMALKIWKRINENKQFSDWSLKIIGTGSDEVRYKRLSAKLRLKNVSFEGRQNPIPYYEKASVFMMTSAFEGWGLTLTEAQQFGVVPLAFNSYASVKDIIEDGYNGFIVDDGDIDGYVKKMELVMSDYKFRYDLARHCIDGSKRYEVGVIGNQWMQLFKDCINEKIR